MTLRVLILLAAPALAVDFNREIRPILSDNCFSCHGPDEKSRVANLRLDTREGAFARKQDGVAYIVPGKSGDSLLLQRIAHANPVLRMPPKASGRALTEKQVDAIRRWIDEGAKWETHWSYTAPRRPDPPKTRLRGWTRNPIDQFVLARLEKEGLKPSPDAPRSTLIRRLTLDLTGLPPTPGDVDAFLADKSPKAYDKLLDRLLESPHYGEKMALHWMDLARYADSHGYHIDPHRDMWPWRDWIIRAFQSNMPFDRFTVEQLAGDLLPNATRDQKLATGFNRNHMINFEGGAIPDEYQTEYVIDRVETTANVFMGMAIGCARCHDHKYDPISQRDFYRFFAFFNGIPEKGLDGTTGNAAPLLFLGHEGQEAEMERLRAAIKDAKEALKEKEIAAAQSAWEKTAVPTAQPTRGILAHWEFDGSLSDSSGGYRYATTPGREPDFRGGIVGKALSFGKGSSLVLAPVPLRGPATLAFWLRHGDDKPLEILRGSGIRVYTSDVFYVPDRKLGGVLDIVTQDAHYRAKTHLPLNRWTHVAFGAGRLHLDAKPVELEKIADGARSAPSESPLESREFRGQLDDIRFYDRALTAAELEILAADLPLASALAIPPDKRGKEEKDRLREHFLASAAPEPLRSQSAELKKLEASLFGLEHLVSSAMVMQEMEKPRDSFVLGRGDYRNKGEKVTPAVPAALPPLPKNAPANRLGLARWLVSPDHPLTARVTVNRFWQNYFGIGLVKTSEDFGSQGESPANVELLDWLATEFVRTGWDVKAMQRLILGSATYRQASRVTPEAHERDPENRMLARMSRFRLQAELVRDNALAVSGLLNAKIGGAWALPYQPGGLWEEMAFGREFSMQTYRQSKGPDLYRRSMYTYWKRTVPPAQMATFDAPDREKCMSRRPVTNTPLQALILMNDPTYVEAARKLAERMIREAGSDPARRIQWAYRRVLARSPEPKETALLVEAAAHQTAIYANSADKARQLLSSGESPRDAGIAAGELAAWTNVATMILNLDEAITKE